MSRRGTEHEAGGLEVERTGGAGTGGGARLPSGVREVPEGVMGRGTS